MDKLFAYFFLGFLTGLIVVELTNGKPAKKANHEMNQNYSGHGLEINHIKNPQQDTFNIQRPSESHNNPEKSK